MVFRHPDIVVVSGIIIPADEENAAVGCCNTLVHKPLLPPGTCTDQ